MTPYKLQSVTPLIQVTLSKILDYNITITQTNSCSALH